MFLFSVFCGKIAFVLSQACLVNGRRFFTFRRSVVHIEGCSGLYRVEAPRLTAKRRTDSLKDGCALWSHDNPAIADCSCLRCLPCCMVMHLRNLFGAVSEKGRRKPNKPNTVCILIYSMYGIAGMCLHRSIAERRLRCTPINLAPLKTRPFQLKRPRALRGKPRQLLRAVHPKKVGDCRHPGRTTPTWRAS